MLVLTTLFCAQGRAVEESPDAIREPEAASVAAGHFSSIGGSFRLEEYTRHFAPNEPNYFLAGWLSPQVKFQISFRYMILNPTGSLVQKHAWMKGFNFGFSQTSWMNITTLDDSFFADSLYPLTKMNEEQIEVKKDELINTRNMNVMGINPNPKNAKDSAMQNISGIRDDKNPGTSLSVEFWVSPINYKGYKMTKNKLVLFGVPGNGDLSLHRIDGVLFLRHEQSVYRLEPSDDFRSLEKVNDPELISKIQ